MDDYKTMLSQLHAKREFLEHELDAVMQAIAAIERLVPSGEGNSTPSVARRLPVQVTADAFFNLSLVEAAKKYLRMVGQPARSTDEIVEALSQGGLPNVSKTSLAAVLFRALKGRQIVKVGKGHWGLTEWYQKKAEATSPTE